MTAQPRSADRTAEFLTIAEAAARYHVSRDYIRHRIIDGALPAVRSGRRIIRIDSIELEKLFRPVQSAAHPGATPARQRSTARARVGDEM